ncbi:MAG: hypothetical protein KDD63_27700, partial [Bacteroidetes bacterium]|nr:hypothetical protein [Bacteroidota bacterium]
MNYFYKLFSFTLAVFISSATVWGQSGAQRISAQPSLIYGDSDYDSPEIRTRFLRQATIMTSQGVNRSEQKYFVNINATGMNDGSSWQDAFTQLEDALYLAGKGDTVWVAEGTYYPGVLSSQSFILANGVHLYGGFEGMENQLNQRNISLHPTILSGDIGQDDLSSPLDTVTDRVGKNSTHVIFTVPGKFQTVLDGFTVTAGKADGDLEDAYGGGIMSFT